MEQENREQVNSCLDHPGQQHQEQPVRLPIDRAFGLSTQDDQLVSQQRLFRQQS